MKQKENLIWIDLEMTGLDPKIDTILEIATIITDKDLHIIAQGPDIVIHHDDTVLENMNSWCKDTHNKSGLCKAVQESTTTLEQAQHETLEFIKKYCYPHVSALCGNTIWQDRFFLRTYMPELEAFLYYQMIDVSSVKRLVHMWYPNDPNIKFAKKDNHRAMIDIEESIQELQHYRDNFFK
jgi:oligoribonuclease